MKTKIRKAQAGVPPAGTTNQVLKKNSNTDFDYDWASNPGGSNLYTINADESVTTWFTTQIARMGIGTSGQGGGLGWTIGSFAGISTWTVDSTTLELVSHGGNLDAGISCSFLATGKQCRMKFLAQGGVAGNADNVYNLVFGNARLHWDGTDWFFGVNGGATVTITGAFAGLVTALNLYDIVWDNTNLSLYVNGTLVGQVAVTFPPGSCNMAISANPLGGGGTVSWKMTAITLSQEL